MMMECVRYIIYIIIPIIIFASTVILISELHIKYYSNEENENDERNITDFTFDMNDGKICTRHTNITSTRNRPNQSNTIFEMSMNLEVLSHLKKFLLWIRNVF